MRGSSSKIYNSKWARFAAWCELQDVDPVKASCQVVASFLNHLFEVDKLAVSTIRGYRAALSRVLKHTNNLELSEHPVLNSLFANFDLERPRSLSVYPKWDLNLVLDALQKPPYEPLSSASFMNLSKKTAFLLLLASGVRRNELHAIDIAKIVKVGEDCWTLRPRDGFMAKNFKPGRMDSDFKGFNIHRLVDSSGQGNSGRKLCPLRALKLYIHRSRAKRGGIKSLFITCNPKRAYKAIHVNTLSSWIKHLIADVYAIAPENTCSLLHRSTHEIRALSASMALKANVSLGGILEQCRWAQGSTFVNFYLKDMTGTCQGLSQFLPLQLVGGKVEKGGLGEQASS